MLSALTMLLLSAEKETDVTPPQCLAPSAMRYPELKSQSLTALSFPPEATRLPSLDIAIHDDGWSWASSMTCKGWGSRKSQNDSLQSFPTVTTWT